MRIRVLVSKGLAGWAHHKGEAHPCFLIVIGDDPSKLHGGHSIVAVMDTDVERELFLSQAKQLLPYLVAILNEIIAEALRAPSEDPFALMPSRTLFEDEIYIIARSEDEAVEAAYQAGIRVDGGFNYPAHSWKALYDRQRTN